jgi:iron(III) transport system ATP-binding protein
VATLTLDGVSKRFGSIQALAPLSISIEQGEFVGVLGPSGCGKTTLLRCLAGLEQPDGGIIRFGDRTVVDIAARVIEPPQRRGLGMVFQDLALWPHLTVFENVAYTLRARRDTQDLADRVREALRAVRLAEHGERYPHQLSGGQQPRVAFARAIVDRPPVLLMDEPLSALDASLRVDLRAELTALTKSLGLTAVYVTHDQDEAMSMADRILVMDDGHVVQDDAPEVLYQRPASRFVADFIGRLNPFDRPVAHNGAAGTNGGGGSQDLLSLLADSTRLVGTGSGIAGIRPEKVHLRANGRPVVALPAEVELVSFLGDRYELRCRLELADRPWVVHSDRRVEVGERVQLHLAPDDLIVTDR